MRIHFSMFLAFAPFCLGVDSCGGSDSKPSSEEADRSEWPTKSPDGYPVTGDAILFATHANGREFVLGCDQVYGVTLQDIRPSLERCEDCDPEERLQEFFARGDALISLRCFYSEDSRLFQASVSLGLSGAGPRDPGIIPGDYRIGGDARISSMIFNYSNYLGEGHDGNWLSIYQVGSTNDGLDAGVASVADADASFDPDGYFHVTDRLLYWEEVTTMPGFIYFHPYHTGYAESQAYNMDPDAEEEPVHLRVEFSVDRALELMEERSSD